MKVVTRRRKREELEARLVSEWVASLYPDAKVDQRVWLSPYNTDPAERGQGGFDEALYMVTGKWADAIIFLPSRTIIVEAKLKVNASALGQILLYHELFRKTPRFRDRWTKPIELAVVYAFPDAQVIQALRARGVLCYHYCPPWAKEAYLKRARNMR